MKAPCKVELFFPFLHFKNSDITFVFLGVKSQSQTLNIPQRIIKRTVLSPHKSDQKNFSVRTFLSSFPQYRKQQYKARTAWCLLPLGNSCYNATLPFVFKGSFIPSCVSQATGFSRMLGMLPVDLGHKGAVV